MDNTLLFSTLCIKYMFLYIYNFILILSQTNKLGKQDLIILVLPINLMLDDLSKLAQLTSNGGSTIDLSDSKSNVIFPRITLFAVVISSLPSMRLDQQVEKKSVLSTMRTPTLLFLLHKV